MDMIFILVGAFIGLGTAFLGTLTGAGFFLSAILISKIKMKPFNDYTYRHEEMNDEFENIDEMCRVFKSQKESIVMSSRFTSGCLLFNYFNMRFVAKLCGEWLDVLDLCRFDTALCCRKSRKKFLAALSKHVRISIGKPLNGIVHCIRWLNIRNIDACCMELNIDFSDSKMLEFGSCKEVHTSSDLFLRYFRRRSKSIEGIEDNYFFRRIEELSFTKCSGVSDDLVVKSCRVCPVLKKLHLGGCKQITNVALICLSIECPMLMELNLFNCSELTDTGIISIAEGCLSLTSLNRGWCNKISDKGLISLSTTATSLMTLDIGGCSALTDISIRSIAENCLLLKRLNMSYNSNFTDISLSNLASNSHLLTSLQMGKCPQISDDGIGELSDGCVLLAELDLYCCEKITDFSLTKIVTRCEGLRSLNLSHCYQISDIGLVNLAGKGRSLQSLRLCGCDMLTEEGLLFFADMNPLYVVTKDY